MRRYESFSRKMPRAMQRRRGSVSAMSFSARSGAARSCADASEALAALAKGASDETLGDPFLREHKFTDANADEIATAPGRKFAEKVTAMPAGEWHGPVASSYGVHLVRVSGRAEPQPVAFESVRDAVARDFSDERRRMANQDFLAGLKARYRITVDAAAIRDAAAPSTKTATR